MDLHRAIKPKHALQMWFFDPKQLAILHFNTIWFEILSCCCGLKLSNPHIGFHQAQIWYITCSLSYTNTSTQLLYIGSHKNTQMSTRIWSMPSPELHSAAYPLENEDTSYTNLFLSLSSSVSLSLSLPSCSHPKGEDVVFKWDKADYSRTGTLKRHIFPRSRF